MAGLPKLSETRSLSRYGPVSGHRDFEDSTDIFFARQLINERIQGSKEKLPPGVMPALGPVPTGLGEIYMWTVEAKRRTEAGRQALHTYGPARDSGTGSSSRSFTVCRA